MIHNVIRVSVVMAAYNEESTIKRAIYSIIAQSYDNWELIIIDDASTDKTSFIVKQAMLSDNRIKMYSNAKNIGLAASLNKGIKQASGDLIARMDADDYSLPDRLKTQVEFIDKNPEVSVLGGGAIYIDVKGNELETIMMPESHNEIVKFLLKSSPFIHPTIMMQKNFWIEMQGYTESLRRAQDYDLWFRGRFSGQYFNLHQPLLKYTKNDRRTFRSLYDGLKVRFRNSNGISENFVSLFWFFVGMVNGLTTINIGNSKSKFSI